ncbi:uncharacterized protein SAZU_7618, partial [Streptomyces azureus]
MSPSGSTAGVQAEAGTFETAWWTASVMVIPTEYDSHRPRRASQATNSWVPPPELDAISFGESAVTDEGARDAREG